VKNRSQPPAKIAGDRLVLALISVMRTLILELSKRGVLDADEFVTILQQTAIAHREAGDPNNLADAIHAVSEHLHVSVQAKSEHIDKDNAR
jgi:hypothetical protein